jgi:hypothetical protein
MYLCLGRTKERSSQILSPHSEGSSQIQGKHSLEQPPNIPRSAVHASMQTWKNASLILAISGHRIYHGNCCAVNVLQNVIASNVKTRETRRSDRQWSKEDGLRGSRSKQHDGLGQGSAIIILPLLHPERKASIITRRF